MTPAELRELLAKATPGEWEQGEGRLADCVLMEEACIETVGPHAEADARLIAALRNSAPALLDRVEALERALRISEAAMDHVVTVEPEGTCDICESCTENLKRARDRARALLRDGEGSR